MAVRKIKGSWWVDLRFRFVRYRKKSPLDTKGGAQAYETELRAELAAKGSLDHLDPKAIAAAKPPTLAEFATRWLRDYVDVTNRPYERLRKRHLLAREILPVLGRLAIDQITTGQVDVLKARLIRSGKSAKTTSNILTVVRKCLSTARDWEVIKDCPRIHSPSFPIPETRVLDDEEVRRLLSVCTADLWGTMILFALRTGLRYSELAALRWEDIDVSAGHLTVRRRILCGEIDAPKNGRFRTIPLPDDARALIRTLRVQPGCVFTHRGSWVRHATAQYNLHRLCRQAGIVRAGWHALRRTYATDLDRRGAPITAIQRLLGHSSITMTMRYVKTDFNALRAAVGLLNVPQTVWAPDGHQPPREALPGPFRAVHRNFDSPLNQAKNIGLQPDVSAW